MTVFEDRRNVSVAPSRGRSEIDLVLDQVRGIERWVARHRMTAFLVDTALSREARLDLVRRQHVVERQRQAMVDWTAGHLRDSDHLLRAIAATRAVVVHRNDWFKSKVAAGLAGGGVAVVADLENGAEAVGVIVAEQPDLVVLEDKLPLVSGLDVTRAVREYAPGAVVVAQVANDWEIGPFLDAGAATAYPRRVPPADIAAELLSFLPGSGEIA